MKRVLLLMVFWALSATVWARESYEAKPSLMPPGGLPVYYDSEGPLSFNLYTHRDLPPHAVDLGLVSSRGCQYGLSIPITASVRSGTSISGAIGDGGYTKAFTSLRAHYPGLLGIYDAKIDIQVTSILGIFSRLCTDINARGYR